MQSLRRRVWATRFFENSVPDAFDAHFFNGLLGPFDGLQQKIRFNATGDNGRAAYFMVVRDGRFVRE